MELDLEGVVMVVVVVVVISLVAMFCVIFQVRHFSGFISDCSYIGK